MPHIIIEACNMEKTMQIVNVHVYVQFSQEYYQDHKLKAKAKLQDLEAKLNMVIEQFFEEAEMSSESKMSNHLYNVYNKN